MCVQSFADALFELCVFFIRGDAEEEKFVACSGQNWLFTCLQRFSALPRASLLGLSLTVLSA